MFRSAGPAIRRVFVILSLIGWVIAPAWGVVIKVPGDEATIQDAVTAAAGGDEIRIAKGEFFENIVIPTGKDGLMLVGMGVKTIIDANDPPGLTGDAITVESDDVVIEMLRIRNGQENGIKITDDAERVIIRHVTVQNVGHSSDLGCVVTEGEETTVENSIFQSCRFGVTTEIGCSEVDDVTVRNNLFRGCDQECIRICGDDAVVEDNQTFRAEDNACIVVEGDDAEVVGNTVSHCGGEDDDGEDDGIVVIGDNPLVSWNDVSIVYGDAIRVRCDPDGTEDTGDCTDGEVSHNTVNDTLGDNGDGLQVTADPPAGAGFAVENNFARRTSEEGIDINGNNIYVRWNTVKDVLGDPSTGDCYDITGDDNHVDDNVADGCGDDGIEASGDRNEIENNDVEDVFEDGITVGGIDNDVHDNKVRRVMESAIEVTGGTGNTVDDNNVGDAERHDLCDEGTGTTTSGNNFVVIATTPCSLT